MSGEASAATPLDRLRDGAAIPAHPLALDDTGALDERYQRALSRYHLDAGATGLAVGVHTTQFELHDDRGLLRTVWALAAEQAAAHRSDPVMVAGLTGDVDQAVAEAELATELGYHAALLSPWGMTQSSPEAMLARAAAVGEVMPVIGFYLQASIGGPHLDRRFWSALFDLPSVVAVKTAPFNRYHTNDVAQALLHHDRWDEVALLTGNDDAIVADLLMTYRAVVDGRTRRVGIGGGLLGQWAVGTRAAVDLLARIRTAVAGGTVEGELLTLATDLVEINQALFDVDNNFAGCVPGVNELLRQQGLTQTSRCLGPDALSPGQSEHIGRIRRRFPELLDESFVADNRVRWLND